MNGDETVSEGLDGGGKGGEGGGSGGVGAGSNRGGELLEEGERCGSDFEGSLSIPDDESIIELLSDGDSSQIPRLAKKYFCKVISKQIDGDETTHVASLVGILGITTSGDSSSRSNTAVDVVDGTESINVNLQVRQGLI